MPKPRLSSPYDQPTADLTDLEGLYSDADNGGAPRLPDFDELLTNLQTVRDNPTLSGSGRFEIDKLITGLINNPEDVPDLPFSPPEPGLGGKLFGGAVNALGYPVRGVLSLVNQAGLAGEAIRDITLGEDPDGINRDRTNPANRLGPAGFVSGLTGEGPLNFLSAATGVEELPFGKIPGSLNIPDAIPFLPDRLNYPDLDSLINFGAEVALDPLTYVRGPGYTRPGQVASTAADARAGWQNIASNLVDQAKLAGHSEEVQEQIARSLYNGSISTLVRDAARGVGGLSREVLSDIGVQSRLTFAGREIVGTGKFVESVLGSFTPRAALGIGPASKLVDEEAALYRRFVDSVKDGTFVSGAAGGVLRGIDNLDASALRKFTNKIIADGGSPLSAIRATDFARASKVHSEALLAMASDAAGKAHVRTGLGEELTEKEIRVLLEAQTPVREGGQAVVDGIRGNMSPFQRAVDDFVNYMDELGVKAKDLRIDYQAEEITTIVDDFIRNTDNEFLSRYLAPFIAFGTQQLDRAADNFLPGKVDSFSAGQLLGGGRNAGPSILNRRTATMRQFFEGISQVEKFGGAHVFGAEALGEHFFKVGNLPMEVFETFQQAAPRLQAGLSALDEIATEAGLRAVGDAVKVDEFQRFILESKDAAFAALSTGDITAVTQSIEGIVSTGRRHLDSLDRLIRHVTLDEGAGAYYADLGASGGRFTRRAAQISDKKLAAEVDRIIKNEWFNPELSGVGSLDYTHLVGPEDRALLREAHARNPEMLAGPLDDLTDWMDEWTELAQDTFDQYEANFTPEVAAQLRNIDTVYHQTLMLSKVFGEGIQTALGGLRRDSLNQGITKEGAENLAQQVLDVHYKAGGTTFFGTAVGRWGLGVHDTDMFLKSLRKAELSNSAMDKMLGGLAKYNRVFKQTALFGTGSQVRNFLGQVRLNYLRGVRTLGRGGYREFEPYYEIALRAMQDEAVTFSRLGASSIWNEIEDRGDRALMKELADTGVLTSAGSGGNRLDRALEVQERALGRTLGRTQDVLGAGQNRLEQFTASAAQTLTSGRVPNLRYRDLTNTAAGLRRANRRELESYMRGALMWSSVAKDGDSVARALNLVSATHFDYWDLTNAGQIADEVMPFFVFRARVARLSAELALSTPSVPLTQFKLHRQEQDRDPYGAGADDEWTFGAGRYRGLSINIALEDPLDQGFETLQSLANVLPSAQGVGDLFDREVYADLTPGLAPFVDAAFEKKESFGGVQDQYWAPARELDGIGPRAAAFLGQGPLINDILETTGNMRKVDGEVYLTPSGAGFLTDFIPLLGRVEGLFREQLIGGRTRRDLLDDPGARAKLERQTLNATFSFIGIPYQLVSDDQRQAVADRLADEVLDYDRLVSTLTKIRAEDALAG